ncbi:hypothetical protein BU15DRAFT_68530 [Melanogaster broomeanus]|nr:hypothetical protein BU15DRAFT_68530 [Melanogaster broomeanus]
MSLTDFLNENAPKYRTSETTTTQQGTHLTPWFDDGNVVLAAEGKHFRVHRGVLALYSEIFKDTFSCPQPQECKDQEMIEGCPIVTLHDTTQDVQIVLRAFYSRSASRVESSYPTSLINPQWTFFQGYEVCGSRVELTSENKNACILGREKLAELYQETFSWLKTRRDASVCTDKNRCAAGIEATCAEIWFPERSIGGIGHDPFVAWDMRWESRLCPKCLMFCKAVHERGRVNAWTQLPAVFGLGVVGRS